MSRIKRIIYLISHQRNIFWCLVLSKLYFIFSDKAYLRIKFRLMMGYKLNLESPRTFCEKLQWLKLYNRKNEYTSMVDKYSAKTYVSSIVGEQYIIPTLGFWKNPQDIDFDSLPDQFVLKVTHGGGGGGVIICKGKKNLEIERTIKQLHNCMKINLYHSSKEWPYKNVNRGVIAEEFMANNQESDLIDYKFYCFNGEPKYCQVIQDRRTIETIDFYDMSWTRQDFIGLNQAAKHSDEIMLKPSSFDEMKNVVCKLAKGIPFVRIDMYEINEKPYFGEITFFPASGYGSFVPSKWNYILGDLINLK